ncbi:hypothetical protein C7U60_11940 [Mesorhizobium plurifarium]|uniref:hypothetical protein n=1 Tax=Sinorhizobium arboris TaxID=76745 RepID=UPI000429ED45|nr:hypothetical protein [Sinorhizobium arboris]PST21970.1 hypothetical protein C7U60_11940 [Mesorhizobium plurifarium]
MSALTLAIDNGVPRERLRPSGGATGQASRYPDATGRSLDTATARTTDEGDVVLAMLMHARSLIEMIAERRRAGNLVRNRVETRRQLARLPTWVRNDLLPAEQQPSRASDRTAAAGEINHDV